MRRLPGPAAALLLVPGVALVLGLVPGVALAAPADPGGPTVNRVVADPAIGENSGIALSPQHAGVLWTVNDSGNPPVLYALGPTGATAARITLTGVADTDWEAVATWRDRTGRALLAAADIGDNRAGRSQIEIDVVAEPSPLRSQTLKPLRRLVLRYPDGATDAESLMVDPRTQRMYVASKGFGSRIYAVPESVWPGVPGAARVDSGVLQPVGRTPALLVTDGAILPSGDVVLRTYTSMLLLGPLPTPHGSGSTGELPALAQLGAVELPAQSQGEGLAIDLATGSVLLSSEGVRQPVLRIGWPAQWPSPSSSAGAAPAGRSPLPAPDPGPPVPVPDASSESAAVGGSDGSGSPGNPTNAPRTGGREPLALGRLGVLAGGSAVVVGALAAGSVLLRRRGARAAPPRTRP
jgi:hypothetical protein